MHLPEEVTFSTPSSKISSTKSFFSGKKETQTFLSLRREENKWFLAATVHVTGRHLHNIVFIYCTL